jgi:hypothetical protein
MTSFLLVRRIEEIDEISHELSKNKESRIKNKYENRNRRKAIKNQEKTREISRIGVIRLNCSYPKRATIS